MLRYLQHIAVLDLDKYWLVWWLSSRIPTLMR